MSLTDWLKNGWIDKHEASRQEISHLMKLVDRDLKECQKTELSADWRFNIAYNAALQCANMALIASGFRTSRRDSSQHFRVIQSLEFTIGADRSIINRFDAFRKKRNISEYDQAGAVSDTELKEMIELALYLRQTVIAWLHSNHPELMIEPA
jgi:hypothetical protein